MGETDVDFLLALRDNTIYTDLDIPKADRGGSDGPSILKALRVCLPAFNLLNSSLRRLRSISTLIGSAAML